MKNKLTQLIYLATKIDRRHIQYAYFVLLLTGFLIARAPVDGGGGPI